MPLRMFVMMGLGLLFLYLLFTVGAPFLLALVSVLLFEPLTVFFMKRLRLNRVAASIISSTLFSGALIGLLGLIGMKLVGELLAFWRAVPGYLREMNGYARQWIDQLSAHIGDEGIELESWVSSLTGALEKLAGNISSALFHFAKGVPDLFIFFIVYLVAVYLFAFSLPTMKSSFLSLFHESSRDQVDAVLLSLRKSVFGFLRAQLVLSALTYVITFVGLLILGTGYPLAIALLVTIVDILPVLGTGSVLVPWACYELVAGDLFTAIGLIVLYLFITVVRRSVEPKILGDAIGISALATLISLYVGYKLIGVIGMFLGPIAVIIYLAARKAGLFRFQIKLD